MDKLFNADPKPILSLCMIVKNESENLPRCLASAKSYVDQIVVVDTGSQDGTTEIALQYGAKVSYFEWCNDFAAARNYAICQASGDWILMLDADEELVVKLETFREEINLKSTEIIAYYLIYTEINDQFYLTPSYRISLFRNIPELRYVGRFHEELKYHQQNISASENITSYLKSLEVLHYGFSKEQQQQKNISRDIPMLERIRQESGLSLRLLYCLAAMYNNIQQPEKTEECYSEAFERLLPNLITGDKPEPFNFIPSLVYNCGMRSLAQDDYETARLLGQRGLEWCPDYPPLNYLVGVTIRELGFKLGAVAYFENCLQLGQEETYYKGDPFDLRFMTTYPADELGNTYMQMELFQEALAAFELVLSFDANFPGLQDKIDNIRQRLALKA